MHTAIPRRIEEIDTPALLVDLDRMEENLETMQARADAWGVRLRPHTKTHRTPEIAKMQVFRGCHGITVAKLGEAEVMAAEGLRDIFIANEIVGPLKFKRLRKLHSRTLRLAVGVDHPDHVILLGEYFLDPLEPLEVMIDVDTGDPRTGVAPGKPTLALAREVALSPGLLLRGIYTHDGQSYDAESIEEVRRIFEESQKAMLETASLLRSEGIEVQEISVGSTPS
ncbi:MAG TPA: alanine racemase, partial [Synergistaceae bacterium]|nr:alanine racemase [Synergistaceae bacterium]